jgi:hypothetical protein
MCMLTGTRELRQGSSSGGWGMRFASEAQMHICTDAQTQRQAHKRACARADANARTHEHPLAQTCGLMQELRHPCAAHAHARIGSTRALERSSSSPVLYVQHGLYSCEFIAMIFTDDASQSDIKDHNQIRQDAENSNVRRSTERTAAFRIAFGALRSGVLSRRCARSSSATPRFRRSRSRATIFGS